IPVGGKRGEVRLIERIAPNWIQHLQNTDLLGIADQRHAQDRTRVKARGLVSLAIKARIFIRVRYEQRLAVLEHPAGYAASAWDEDAVGLDILRTGIAARHGQLQIAVRRQQKERGRLRIHHAAGHVENRRKKFLRFRDAIDQRADLDKTAIDAEFALELLEFL